MFGGPAKGRRVADDAADAASSDGFFIDNRSREQLQMLFDLLDKDGNGLLDSADWPATAEGAGHFDKFREHFDADGSKSITPEEFVNGMKKAVLQQQVSFPASTGLFSFPSGSHGDHFQKLNMSVNAALQNLCKALHESYESATGGYKKPVPAPAPAPAPSPMVFGGLTPGSTAVDAQVSDMVKNVMQQIRDTYRLRFPEVKFENATFEEALKPISCKSQVVCGINYFVKAQLANEKFGNKYVLLKIYKHFANPPVLNAMQTSGVTAESSEEF